MAEDEAARSASGETTAAGDPPTPVADGLRIGPYRVIRSLGEGGMGTVLLAVRADQAYTKRVAIKVIKRGMDTDEVLRRFRRERQILAALEHPNVARLLDGGTTQDGLPYLVMEYVDGRPVTEYCESHSLATADRLRIFQAVCRAVQFAHQNLVVHRDLKPTNILVMTDGTVKLLDFGIAKLLNPELLEATFDPTSPQAPLMTPEYASPEQVRGEAVSTASDVYSLGVLLYEILTGRRPYRLKQRTLSEIVKAVCEQTPEKPSTAVSRPIAAPATDEGTSSGAIAVARDPQVQRLRRRLAGDLDTIVLKALQKEPARRYASAEQLAEDIDRHFAGVPVRAQRDTLRYRASKFAGRHRLGLAVTTAVAVVLVAATVVSATMAVRARRAQQEAAAISDFLRDDLLSQASAAVQASPDRKPDPDVRVRTVLDRAAGAVAAKFASQPRVEAAIRRTIGRTYRDLGLYEQAREQFERTVELQRRELGDRDPETLRSTVDLAEVHYKFLSRYDDAEALMRRVLDANATSSGQQNADTLSVMDNLSQLYTTQGKYADAEALAADVVSGRRRLLGEAHHDTQIAMGSLAALLRVRGQIEESERLFIQALTGLRRSLGPEHPETLNVVNNLVVLYGQSGRYAQAEPLARDLLDAQRKTLGERHFRTLNSLFNLSVIERLLGNLTQAETYGVEVLNLHRETLGPAHTSTLKSTVSLALICAYRGDVERASALFRDGVEGLTRLGGPEHPDTLSALTQQAEALTLQRRYSDAEALLVTVVSTRRRKFGPEHIETLRGAAWLGWVQFEAGKWSEAEVALREAAAGFEKMDSKDWLRYRTLVALGASIGRRHAFSDAEPHLLAGYQGLVDREASVPTPHRAIIAKAAQWTAELYEAWGKPGQVTTWSDRARQGAPRR